MGAAYRAVDAAIGALAESFGTPATIIIVSDHGWEFSAYAHRTAPSGVAIIAGAGATGFGGTMRVESIAATALALIGAPATTAMAPPIPDLVTRWNACVACADGPGQFLSSPRDDAQRRNRLRSLGYVTR